MRKTKGIKCIKYLYENEEYLDEIREGRIICEGIDIDEIRKNLNQ